MLCITFDLLYPKYCCSSHQSTPRLCFCSPRETHYQANSSYIRTISAVPVADLGHFGVFTETESEGDVVPSQRDKMAKVADVV